MWILTFERRRLIMGSVQRKTSKYLELYRKKFRSKVLTVLSFTPPGTTKNDFMKLFSDVYPEDVVSMEKHFIFYQEKNKSRYKGKPLYFPSPSELLYGLAKSKINKINISEWNPSQAIMAKAAALSEAMLDRRKRQIKYRENNISTQFVTPRYIEYLIGKYWRENVKIRRLFIIIECGKFKNEMTILFFRKIMNGENDWFIRNYCFRILQHFDEVVYLPSKGKGKREKYDSLVNYFGCDYKEDIGRTPKDIIEEIYGGGYIENNKHFDVFISHAVLNADLVEELVFKLNSIGLVAFVDWKSDRQDLNRTKISHYTPRVLELRMKQSKCLILIRTKESDLSTWVSWEIGYFSALGKKIAIFSLDDDCDNKNELIDALPIAKFIDGEFFIFSDERKICMIDWVNKF
ncbi:TIR domain-containing protein [Pectobacterium versatile]|uniref:TIR domain-containing protein n=1 Tax=Pectobacterium versatile TaxID=2488639 RepID=A0ABU8JYM6_9GAMM|nr:TIR domain-containing protein [Pectobacterium versatile]UCP83406.1 TIR domain-containing protein [Pectobacterium versatile]